MSQLIPLTLIRKIEYALLEPQWSREDMEAGCAQAASYDCYGVVVKPHYVEVARKLAKEAGMKTIAVVGFPHGGMTTATKMYETQDVLQRGADEISMALNLGALRDHDDLHVRNDIATVVRTARGRPVTVILETYLMDEEEIVRGCRVADEAGASFVQSGTGFAPAGATPEDIYLMRTSTRLPVKAAGRINSLEKAIEMIHAGAARIVAGRFG